MTPRRFFSAFFRFATLTLFALTSGCSAPAENEEPAPEPTNQWNGATYLLDIAAQDWSYPRGIGQEIDAFVPNFLLRVDGDAPDTFDVMLGTADAEGQQDPCTRTSVVGATATPPAMMLGPSEYSLFIKHTVDPVAVEGTIYDLTIKDVLPNGKTPSEVGEFSATMDFRELYQLFTLIINPTADKVCTLLEDSYSSACAPCPNDGEPFCLTVKAIGLGATPTQSAIEPIDATDPSCVPTPPPGS